MFGHDGQNQHHDTIQPVQDDGASVTDNPGGMTMPPVDDGSASGFMEDTAPQTTAVPGAAPAIPATVPPNTDELLDIKQQALQQLTPLIGHLEQTPEEKFRTTMMMIQASDNDSLIKAAYEAAMAIPDEKVRAQALLDIVNEINYFTHGQNDSAEA